MRDRLWDERLADSVVGKCAARAIRRFGAFPDFAKDDLIQEGVQKVRENWHRYNPKWAKSTFIYRVAWCHIQTLHRNRTRLGQRETKYVHDRLPPEPEEMEHDSLPEWMAERYREVCERMRDRVMLPEQKTGRPKMTTPAQDIAIALLRTRMNQSFRGVELVLSQNPELCETIGLARVPSYRSLARISESVTKLKLKSAG